MSTPFLLTIPQPTINTRIPILLIHPRLVIGPLAQFDVFEGMSQGSSSSIADCDAAFYLDDGLFVDEFEGVGAMFSELILLDDRF
jgi:hypothetical protein